MQGGFRIFLGRRSLQVVLGPQPLAKSSSSVMFHRRVGFTDWSQTEVVGPPNHHPVERFDYGLPVQPGFISSGFFAYRLTDALHPFLRRGRAQIGSARFGRVTPTKRDWPRGVWFWTASASLWNQMAIRISMNSKTRFAPSCQFTQEAAGSSPLAPAILIGARTIQALIGREQQWRGCCRERLPRSPPYYGWVRFPTNDLCEMRLEPMTSPLKKQR
jgi:hypothetical protein